MRWSKTADAGGIGSMRQGIARWRALRLKRERRSVGCGLTRIRCRRGSGGKGAVEAANGEAAILLHDCFTPAETATLRAPLQNA